MSAGTRIQPNVSDPPDDWIAAVAGIGRIVLSESGTIMMIR